MAIRRMTFARNYAHGLRGAIRQNAPAFAFSIMITSSFGSVASEEGTPSIGDVYGFMAGAVLGFVAVLVLASGGFRRTKLERERTSVIVVGSALALGSTAIGLGAATLVGALVDGILAWSLGPFAGCAAFMLVLAFEFAIVERMEET